MINDKSLVIRTVALHYVLLQSKAETDQFCEGLSKLGVLNEIKKHPDIMRPMLTNSGLQHLTAEVLRKMFLNVIYSEWGSNSREKEENAYMMFIDYLEECEDTPADGCATVMEDAERRPECILPIGFPHDPVLNFADNQYPTASTCALQLILPTKYYRYCDFKAALDLAFICHGGFGLS